MCRRAQIRALLIVVLVAGSAACGEADDRETRTDQTTSTIRTERSVIDGVIDHIVRSQALLQPASGATDGELIVKMMVTSRDLKGATNQLRHPALGVPESTLEHARAALTALASALDTAISCKTTHLAAAACGSAMSLVLDRVDALGTELVRLIPYGSRSVSQIGTGQG